MTWGFPASVVGMEAASNFRESLVSILNFVVFHHSHLSGGALKTALPFWRETTGTQGSHKPCGKTKFGIRAWGTRFLPKGVKRDANYVW